MLRDGLLAGSAIVVAGAGELGAAVSERAAGLGASVRTLPVDWQGDEPAFAGTADVLVWDGAAAVADGGVRAALDGAWLAIRATAGATKIVLLAPPDGSAHAQAARAGLENLARTTSIEWARNGTRIVTLLGGEAEQVAEMTAYLASPAGDYFSGTALMLSS